MAKIGLANDGAIRERSFADRQLWSDFLFEVPVANTLVVDFSLGGWRPRQAATELAQQLGMSMPVRLESSDHPISDPRDNSDWQAEIVGRGIDEEAAGRRTVRNAFADAHHIGNAIKVAGLSRIIILAARFALPMREEDLFFIHFLSRCFAETSVVRIEAPPSEPSLCGLFPALIPSELLVELPGNVDCSSLRAGLSLADPFGRPDIKSTPKHLFGQLSGFCTDEWVQAYCAVHGHNLFANTPALVACGASAHAAGSADLATSLLARAYDCGKSPAERALALSRLQGARISRGDFSAAANAPPTGRAAPVVLTNYIDQMRAWGQTMSGRAKEACAVLEPLASELSAKSDPSVYDLYMLNIAALNRLRRGDIDGAEHLERLILARRTSGKSDPRLAYINWLNLSRLSRRRGDAMQARVEFRRAFAAFYGTYSAWEFLHLTILEAMAAESLNEVAGEVWLRAALLWLCEPTPEAIPRRILGTLFGPHPATDTQAFHAIADFFISKIGSDIQDSEQSAAHFLRIDCGEKVDRVVASTLGCFAILPQPHEKYHRVENVRQLRQIVSNALSQIVGCALPADSAICIDLSRGIGIELGVPATVRLALRHASSFVFANRQMHELTGPLRERLWQRARLEIAPAVTKIEDTGDEVVLVFSRRFPALHCRGVTADIVRAAKNGALLTSVAADWTELQYEASTLEDRHAILLSWDEAACIEAGIK